MSRPTPPVPRTTAICRPSGDQAGLVRNGCTLSPRRITRAFDPSAGADGELLAVVRAMDVGQAAAIGGPRRRHRRRESCAETSPPSDGMIRISGTGAAPPRRENAMRSPSGENRGDPQARHR